MKHIYNIHHYLGTFFFSMFLIWFLSGFVMMYKSFPFLTEEVRIAKQEQLQELADLPHPATVFEDFKGESSNSLRINEVLHKPVYHLSTAEGKLISRFAHSEENLKLNKAKAVQIARDFTGITSDAEVEVLNEVDQWIPRPRYLKHLPVYKVCFEDQARSFVHISSKTGEVISNTSRTDRVWAWLGAIPHWIYLKEIRMHQNLWSWLCMILASFGFIMALSGIITGIARSKKKPKASFKRFKNKWYNIHYYTGLFFGLFICTWVFSGFMSMTPFNWSDDYTLSRKELKIWQGRSGTLQDITTSEWKNFKQISLSESVKEVHFSSFAGKLFTTFLGKKTVKSIGISKPNYEPLTTDLSQRITLLDSKNPVVNVQLLKEYDNYYYDKNNIKKLPVFKITTANQLAYYLNPANGNVILRSDITNKIERWLYHGLHSWDFQLLTSNRPLWDLVVIFLLLGGTVVCITAVGLGIKFIRRKRRRHIKRTVRNKARNEA